MPHITVDDDQDRVIAGASASVEIRNSTGQRLGYVAQGFTPEDEEDLAIAKQRRTSNEPRYTTKEILEHLNSLEQG